ncbi:hypothetical protein GCM10010486_38650 [Nonomuraea roseoviolacea subsp. carminata]
MPDRALAPAAAPDAPPAATRDATPAASDATPAEAPDATPAAASAAPPAAAGEPPALTIPPASVATAATTRTHRFTRLMADDAAGARPDGGAAWANPCHAVTSRWRTVTNACSGGSDPDE